MAVLVALLVALMRLSRMFRARRDATRAAISNSAVVERLEKWAVASCVEHALRRHEDDSVALYAAKTSAKTARQYQSLLRTLTSHWKMPFGKIDRGWLILLTDTEYRAAIAGATVRQDCAASDHGEVAVALHSVGEASGASCTTADKTRGRPRDTPLAGRWL